MKVKNQAGKFIELTDREKAILVEDDVFYRDGKPVRLVDTQTEDTELIYFVEVEGL